jgi:hypothetical protein
MRPLAGGRIRPSASRQRSPVAVAPAAAQHYQRNASIPGLREKLRFLRDVAAAMIRKKIAPTVNAFTRAPLSAA